MTAFCIQNGEVILPDQSVPGGTVILVDGRIRHAGAARKTPRGATEIDARGGYVTPGLIDVHIHGAGMVGLEACTEEDLEQIQATLACHGVLQFVPTMMADESVMGRMASLLKSATCRDRLPGLYVEGPFVNLEKCGGIQKKYIRPVDLRYLEELQTIAEGRIRMMTFAPELDGADKLPAAMRGLRIQPCVGHSLATAEQAAEVCGRSKICSTHLFNAMSGLDHREPGLAAFALNCDSVYAELNPDGTHVAPDLLKVTWKAKRSDRIVLISDAVISAGAEPGTYEYMNKRVRNTGQGVYYEDSGTLIGSSSLLNEGVRRFIKFTGAPVHEAVRMASLNPANLLGMGRRTGSLEAGKSGDIVVFSRKFDKVAGGVLEGDAVAMNGGG